MQKNFFSKELKCYELTKQLKVMVIFGDYQIALHYQNNHRQ